MSTPHIRNKSRKAYIKEHYDTERVCNIANALNVSEGTVYNLINEMGIKRSRAERYSMGLIPWTKEKWDVVDREITSGTISIICGDIVRHRKGNEPIKDVFLKQKTAETLKMTMKDVIRVYNESLANGRYAAIERFIKNTDGTMAMHKPLVNGRRFRTNNLKQMEPTK